MAYIKPAFLPRKVFNRIAMRFGLSGTETLTVPGRTTGDEQRIPVIPVEHDQRRYLVSTRGESHWVRNARAAGAVTLGGQRVAVTEVPVGARGPVIEAYRAKAGRAVTAYWSKLPDDADHPTFLLGATLGDA